MGENWGSVVTVNTTLSLSLSLSHTYIYINIYIYIFKNRIEKKCLNSLNNNVKVKKK
jgi:hypothetical protein